MGVATFGRSLDLSRELRSHKTFDAQAMRQTREDAHRRTRNETVPRAPEYDNRGHGYPAAGDTQHSRIPVSGEEKAHYHSEYGLTSLAHDNLGGAGRMKGYGSVVRGIPGFRGFVPGKAAENVFAEGWSKSHERALGMHFHARATAPKKWSLLTEGGTMVGPVAADTLAEIRIFNPSYHDDRGWSNCDFAGKHVDPAGRLAPKDRQEGFGHRSAAINLMGAPIHGYTGWVPGKVGESVVGERICKTNAISAHLFKKNQIRITQR